jgi:hypothetical protein
MITFRRLVKALFPGAGAGAAGVSPLPPSSLLPLHAHRQRLLRSTVSLLSRANPLVSKKKANCKSHDVS